jgi:hypothetical protein
MTPLGSEHQSWPTSTGGKLLQFICQLNLAQAPVVPPRLEDIKLITFFIEPETASLQEENGSNWVLRAYKSLEGLAPLPRPPEAPKLPKGFECRWEESSDLKAARTKLGGKPAEIQSEPWWDYRAHPATPEYCLQINSEEKAGVFFGAGGTVYLARGTAPDAADRWFLDLQMF